MLLLGEPGCGKSTVLFRVAQRALKDWHEILSTPISRLRFNDLPWLPLFVELKQCKPENLEGMLPRLLKEQYHYSDDVVTHVISALSHASASKPRLRILLMCDGLDELQGACADIGGDFLTTIVGSADVVLPGAAFKMVVTSRESAFSCTAEEVRLFRPCERKVLLPFSDTQVRLGMPRSRQSCNGFLSP